MAKDKPRGRMVDIPVDPGTQKADKLSQDRPRSGWSAAKRRDPAPGGRRTGVVEDSGSITGRDTGKGKSR